MKSIIVILFLLFFSGTLFADQPRTSNLSIWAENKDVFVLHTHNVHAWTISESKIQIVRKADGKEIFQSEATPFTALIAVENGEYFAGLSDLQAGSLPHGYNFALFSSSGKFISRVYVSRDTEYCEKVRQSVSQYIGWFARNPNIVLERSKNGQVSAIIIQPFYHDSKPCKLPVGDHLVKRSE